MCKNGNHVGINNTTGRCPGCGEQIESPSKNGFGYHQYFNPNPTITDDNVEESKLNDFEKETCAMIDTLGQSMPHEDTSIRMTIQGAKLLIENLTKLKEMALIAKTGQSEVIIKENLFDSSGEGYNLSLAIYTEENMWTLQNHYFDYPPRIKTSVIQPIEIKAFDSINTATFTAIQLHNTAVKLRLNSLLSLLEQFITIGFNEEFQSKDIILLKLDASFLPERFEEKRMLLGFKEESSTRYRLFHPLSEILFIIDLV